MVIRNIELSTDPLTKDRLVWSNEGSLAIREDMVPSFSVRGWTSAGAIIDAQDVDVFRKLPDRENARLTCAGPHGPVRAYLKRHTQPSAGPHGPGWQEFFAGQACQRAGIAIAPVLAVGRDGLGREFFMSESLEGYLPADDFVAQAESQSTSGHQILALLDQLGQTLGRLHRAGLFHRDMYWCHFFVREEKSGHFDIRLIDLQRIHQPRWRRNRWQIKDLAQFLYSFPAGWNDPSTRARWFACYLGKRKLSLGDHLYLWLVQGRALLYRWREGDPR